MKSVRVLLSSIVLHLAAFYWLQSFGVSGWLVYSKGVGGKRLSENSFSTNKMINNLFSILDHAEVSQLSKKSEIILYS